MLNLLVNLCVVLCIILNIWCGLFLIGKIINKDIFCVENVLRLLMLKILGLNIFVKLNRIGFFLFVFMCWWKIFWLLNLKFNVSSMGNSVVLLMWLLFCVCIFSIKIFCFCLLVVFWFDWVFVVFWVCCVVVFLLKLMCIWLFLIEGFWWCFIVDFWCLGFISFFVLLLKFGDFMDFLVGGVLVLECDDGFGCCCVFRLNVLIDGDVGFLVVGCLVCLLLFLFFSKKLGGFGNVCVLLEVGFFWIWLFDCMWGFGLEIIELYNLGFLGFGVLGFVCFCVGDDVDLFILFDVFLLWERVFVVLFLFFSVFCNGDESLCLFV